MKNRKIAIGFILSMLFILLIAPVQGAPAATVFVVNDELKLGAKFFLGDKFYQSKLPEGWRIYDDDWVVYENGLKQIKDVSEYGDLEALCNSFGYTYIGAIGEGWNLDDFNSGVPRMQINYYLFAVITLTVLAIFTIAFIFIWKRKR